MKKQTAKILDEIEIPNRFADAEKAFEKGRQKTSDHHAGNRAGSFS